jgi:hypothetical protein
MNPLAQEALASLIRHVLTVGSGYLVARGVWTEEAATNYVAAGALALVGVLWGLYQKYVARTKLVTALAIPATTETALEAKIADGQSAPSSTAKTKQPHVGL